jgi:hypothetical protein
MKKYTQKDFDRFEIVDGVTQCPSGDYTDIREFPSYCSFGEQCSFGESCSFGNKCKADSIYWDKYYIPDNLEVEGMIYPSGFTRLYWIERFSDIPALKKAIEIGKCYDDLLPVARKYKKKILKMKLMSWEKWILNSWLKKGG